MNQRDQILPSWTCVLAEVACDPAGKVHGVSWGRVPEKDTSERHWRGDLREGEQAMQILRHSTAKSWGQDRLGLFEVGK